MSRPLNTLLALGAALLAPIALQAPPAQAASGTAAPPAAARVIVKYRDDAGSTRKQALAVGNAAGGRAQSLAQRLGVPLRAGVALAERSEVLQASGLTSAELAQRLAAQPDVEYAVPDQRRRRVLVPNDPLYPAASRPIPGVASGQWYLRAPNGSVRSSLNAEPAWDVPIADPNVVVAVLDTGVRFDHPDLLRVANGGNLLDGYDMISDLDVANDGGGRDADASDPGDWITEAEANQVGGPFHECTTFDPGTNKYPPEDSSWHGTQVSGLVGASTNNVVGMASVGRTVRVLPVRVLGKCGGFDSDIIAGMRWAAGLAVPGVVTNTQYPARVLNLSLGGEGACSAAYREAVAELTALKVVVVASVGNTAGHAVNSPANCPGVIGVGGLRHAGTKVGFSDLGPQLALSAPAGNCINVLNNQPCLYPILTVSNAGLTTPVVGAGGALYTDSFNASLGTSFSAPLVAGTAALMLAAQPALAAGEVRALLQLTARSFPTSGATNEDDPTPVPQCKAPQYDNAGQPVDQEQCYCTTSTCGTGMADAGLAVAAAGAGQSAQIGVSAAAVSGQPLTLSYTAVGRSDSVVQWELLEGSGGFSAVAADGSVTLTPTSTGSLTVAVTVATGAGQALVTRTLDVQPGASTGGGGGGGGGALGIGWLALLLAAVLALRRSDRAPA